MYDCSSNSEETFAQERAMNARYREICIYLWRMIKNYLSVTPDNVALMMRLFEMAVEMTSDVAYLETDPTLSEYLQLIVVEDVPGIRQHIHGLVTAVLKPPQPNSVPFHDRVWNNTPAHNPEQAVAIYRSKPDNPAVPNEPAQHNPSTRPSAAEEARDEARKQTIQAARREPMQGGLDSLSGLNEAKQLIREAVILPTKFPNLFKGGSCPWTRVLLYGPPGTGKTQLAHATASEANAQFYAITSADLLSSWIGESEKLIRELFRTAGASGERAVVFIDELDGMCRRRDAGEADHTRRVKTELMVQMELLGPQVFLLAATNCPWDLDPAFVRRFQRRVYVPLPDSEARLSIMRRGFQDAQASCLTEAEWTRVADLTDGYSGSDLADLTKAALIQPIKELDKARHWLIEPGGTMSPTTSTNPMAVKRSLDTIPPSMVTLRDVNIDDFLASIATTPKSVSTEDVDQYRVFNKKYA